MPNKTTVEQWRAFVTFVEAGTYAKAAEQLFRSPSSVFDAIKQLGEKLDIKLFYVKGRNTVITDKGQALLRRARWILGEMDRLENLAANFNKDWEAEIGIAIEAIFPSDWLHDILKQFDSVTEVLRLQVHETALSQTQQLLIDGKVDIAILPEVPDGYVGRVLTRIPFVAVAHPDHELLQQKAPIRLNVLLTHRQIVIRDTGSTSINAGWLVGDQRWTVTDMNRRVECVREGLGFAWLPVPIIQEDLESGNLIEVPLQEGAKREVALYLVFADRDNAGPGVIKLAKIFSDYCSDTSLSSFS